MNPWARRDPAGGPTSAPLFYVSSTNQPCASACDPDGHTAVEVPLPVTTLPSASVSNQPPEHTTRKCHCWPAGRLVQVSALVLLLIELSE